MSAEVYVIEEKKQKKTVEVDIESLLHVVRHDNRNDNGGDDKEDEDDEEADPSVNMNWLIIRFEQRRRE